MRIKYVILNGPPNSGKSTVARWLTRQLSISDDFQTAIQDEPAGPVKHFVATLLGERYSEMNKDKPRAELGGRSVRQFVINLSEDHIKAEYGPDFLGRMLVYRSLRRLNPKPDYVILESSQDGAEIDAIPDRYIVRMDRDGCTFDNDSRGFLATPNFILLNNGSLDDLMGTVILLVENIKAWAQR